MFGEGALMFGRSFDVWGRSFDVWGRSFDVWGELLRFGGRGTFVPGRVEEWHIPRETTSK